MVGFARVEGVAPVTLFLSRKSSVKERSSQLGRERTFQVINGETEVGERQEIAELARQVAVDLIVVKAQSLEAFEFPNVSS